MKIRRFGRGGVVVAKVDARIASAAQAHLDGQGRAPSPIDAGKDGAR